MANDLQPSEVSSIWTRITIRLFVIKLALKWSTSDGNGVVGPRRHTMNSTVAATGIDNILSALSKPYSCEDGFLDPPCKIGEQSLYQYCCRAWPPPLAWRPPPPAPRRWSMWSQSLIHPVRFSSFFYFLLSLSWEGWSSGNFHDYAARPGFLDCISQKSF